MVPASIVYLKTCHFDLQLKTDNQQLYFSVVTYGQ